MTRSRIGIKSTLCLALAALALVAGVLISQGALAGPAASQPSEAKAAPPSGSKIDARVLADTANGARTGVVIYLADQANVNAGLGMKDQDARGWYVYNTLKAQADRTQGGLKALLTAQGITYQAFWVANMIIADGVDATQVNLLAARADVARLDSNRAQRWIEDPAILNASDTTNSPAAIEWGVQRVNAPAVWALGYTGQGIVVANQDTGMRWTHTFIKSQYRGWNGAVADHNYNWHDSIHTGGGACGPNSAFPCDDNAHGTHTTGTMVGDDGAGNQVGVAPGAKWIGCRNMNVGVGSPATYSECFQFFIAPTDLNGNNPNPALRPHVMNNSWGCDASEGCNTGAELETIVNNTEAAGIFVEASAGNSGPGCSSVNSAPAIYSAAFSTGAIDINNNLAGFSSRGPSTFYTPNILKPNVSAPGVNVRSSTNGSDTSTASFSGTSMAGPHVVGVVALLWSARPQLVRDIAATKAILQNTANPNVVLATVQTCGGIPSSQIPNNSFGYGRVDALAAVNSVPAQGTPTVTVTGTPPTATRTATTVAATATRTAVSGTATPCAGAAAWTELTPLPVNKARAVGVSTSNAIYLFGGRPDGTTYTRDIYRYDLAANTYSLLATQLPDLNTSNMAGGLLTFPEGQRAFIVGGSGTGSTYISRTLAFDPGTNTLTAKAPWPASPLGLPGGWAVANNKFYIFGGLDVTASGGFTAIWVYDPTTNTWTQSAASLSLGRGYIATETMPDGLIYIAGGSQVDSGGSLTDETVFEKFNPTNNTIALGPPLPTAKSNDHGYNFNGKFLVAGGGFNTVDTLVQVYDPAANSWSVGPPMLDPVRNYAKGYGLNGAPIAIGGFDATGSTGYNFTQVLSVGACATATATVATTSTRTPTAVGTTGATRTATATPQPTACAISFQDVPVGSTFYTFIRCLACRGIVGGYPCGGPGEPCPGNYYRPNNNVTRGQVSKIVSESAGFSDAVPSTQQTFEDVAPGSTFHLWIERLSVRGIIGGYPCGGPFEPCVGPTNRPYFRPNNNVTRGQLSKITSGAAGWTETPTAQTFQDVAVGSTFYVYIERMAARGIISGYPCGGPFEPCVAPGNRPYFRPNNNATRGQMSKIAASAFFPNCATPARAPAPSGAGSPNN